MYIQVYNTISQSSTISLHVHTGIQYNQSVQYNLPSCTNRYTIQPISIVQSPFMYIQVYNKISQYSTISLHVHIMYIQVYNKISQYSTISLHVYTGIQYNQSVQYNLPSCTYIYLQVYNATSRSSTISLHVYTGIQYNQSVHYNLPSCTYRYTIQPVSLVQSPFMYIQVYNTTSQYSTISLHVHTGIKYNQSV